MSERGDSESEHQQHLFRWAWARQAEHPELAWLYANPNGGYRFKATAARLRREGVRAGVPDISLDHASTLDGKLYYGLRVELKVGKNKPSAEQRVWLDHLEEEGYFATVCYGWVEAAEVISRYLGFYDEDLQGDREDLEQRNGNGRKTA